MPTMDLTPASQHAHMVSGPLAWVSLWLFAGQERSPAEHRSAQYLAAACAIGAAAALITAMYAHEAAYVPLAAYFLSVVSLPLLLRTGINPVVVHSAALISVALFLLTMHYLSNGLGEANLSWYGVLPLAGGLLMGRLGILFAAVLGGTCVTVLMGLHHFGWFAKAITLNAETVIAIDALLFLACISSLTLVYSRLQNAAIAAAEQAASARARFLAQMSHELRTPMNGVLGVLQLIENQGHTPQLAQDLALIRRSGEAMVAIVDDLLDYSKLEANQLAITPVSFEVRALVDDVIGLYSASAKAKNLRLSTKIGEDVPEWLLADALRIRQVLQNLVSNAVKFSVRGTVIVQISWQENRLLGSVIDQGIGIATHELPRLFKAFHQANDDTPARYGGTGLGLNISRRLCELMGGELQVKSELGQGSEFSFSCEATEDHSPELQPVFSLATPELQGKVLVVEDNEVNQIITRRLCEKAGLDVQLAHDGAQALHLIQTQRFDLVLMDCHMPVMDGFVATQQIRALGGAYAEIPIVALTASAMPEEIRRCKKSGMNQVLAKPLKAERLFEIMSANLPPPSHRLTPHPTLH